MSIPPAAGTALNAADRLARTRLAIIDEVQRARHGGRPPREPAAGDDASRRGPEGRWSGLGNTVHTWWQQHPAHLVMELAEAALRAWAQRHPMKLLAASAAAGALLVIARPWRLVSVTGLLLTALRSPQLSSLALSALARSRGTADPSP